MAYAKITLIGAMDYYSNRPEDLFDLLELPEGLEKEVLIDDLVYRAGDFELLHIDPPYTRLALGAFSKKWKRTWQKWYDALQIEYNPLHNYDRTEEGTDSHTGTQSIDDTGSQTIANTGTQTTANTGTQKVDNTGTQTNKATGTQNTDNTSEIEYGSSKQTSINQSTIESGTKSTVTTNTVSAFNESGWSNKDKSDTLETPNLTTTVTGQTTENNSGSDVTTGNTLLTNNLTDQRTDNLSETRTDNLNQQRTDNLNQLRTDNLSHDRTDDLLDTHNFRAYGNIGVTTSQQMLQSELDIQKWNIYEHIADMIISEFCIMIY